MRFFSRIDQLPVWPGDPTNLYTLMTTLMSHVSKNTSSVFLEEGQQTENRFSGSWKHNNSSCLFVTEKECQLLPFLRQHAHKHGRCICSWYKLKGEPRRAPDRDQGSRRDAITFLSPTAAFLRELYIVRIRFPLDLCVCIDRFKRKTGFYLFPLSQVILFLSPCVRSQLCNLQLRRSFVKSEKISPDDGGIIRVWACKVQLFNI